MTLLTICTNVADEVNIDRPTSVIGNPQTTAQRLLRYANRAGVSLMKAYPWQALRKEVTFTSVASETQTSILPADFDRFVPETFWDRSGTVLISGPVTAVEWQGIKALSYTGRPKFAYRGDDVLVIPTPSAGSTFAFEYVSNLWCASSGGTGQAAWAADTDVGVIDEELITRAMKFIYLSDSGLPNEVAFKDLKDYTDTLTANDQPGAGIMVSGDIFNYSGGRHFTGAPPVSILNY